MTNSANIVELFSSVQGEGPHVGRRQFFIRFADCNLDCDYCDTKFETTEFCNVECVSGACCYVKEKNPLFIEKLLDIIKCCSCPNKHSLSLTGGEPLLQHSFIKELAKKYKETNEKNTIYLETNGTLHEELKNVIDDIDIISMDIKLESSTGKPTPWGAHNKFIKIALEHKKEIFLKIVATTKLNLNEIEKIEKLLCSEAKDLPIIIQPITTNIEELKLTSNDIFNIQKNFASRFKDVRVIPQVHKYLDVL